VVVIVVLMTRPKFIFKGVRVDEDSGVGFGRTQSGLRWRTSSGGPWTRRGTLPVILEDGSSGAGSSRQCDVALLAIPVYAVPYWSGVLANGPPDDVLQLKTGLRASEADAGVLVDSHALEDELRASPSTRRSPPRRRRNVGAPAALNMSVSVRVGQWMFTNTFWITPRARPPRKVHQHAW